MKPISTDTVTALQIWKSLQEILIHCEHRVSTGELVWHVKLVAQIALTESRDIVQAMKGMLENIQDSP